MTPFLEGAPCWVDAALPDLETGRRFYGGLLGWTFHDTDTDSRGRSEAHVDGQRVAALVARPDDRTLPAWTVYFASRDAVATATRIQQSGGRILTGPAQAGEAGTALTAADPEGALFGVWQAGTLPGFELMLAPGSYCWAEVYARDAVLVDPFYESVFPYDTRRSEGSTASGYKVWHLDAAGERGVAGRLRMGPGHPADMPSHFLVCFAVHDCDSAVRAIRELGGRVTEGPTDASFGRYAVAVDNQGADFAVIDRGTRPDATSTPPQTAG